MLLTKKDAAKRLGLAPRTVDRLVRAREMAAGEFYGRRKDPEAAVGACYNRHLVRSSAREIRPGVVYKPGMKLV